MSELKQRLIEANERTIDNLHSHTVDLLAYKQLIEQVVELKKLANCLLDVDECYCCGREFPYGETAHNPDCLAKAILEVKL